ncbi:MAG: DUF6427 family protein [Crocinitomicaceae bacterium]
MLKWFIGNRPIVLLLLPLIIVLFVFLNLWSNYYEYSIYTNLGFWGDKFQFPKWSTLILGPVIVLVNAIFLTNLFNRNSFIDRNTYVTALVYVAYYSFYHGFYQVDGLAISHFLMILTLFEIFKLQPNEDGKKSTFNAGFFAGLAMTFHPALLVIFPFLVIMVLVLRPVILREFLLLIIGFFVPLIYAYLFYRYFNQEISMQLIATSTNFEKVQIDFLVTAVLFSFTVLLSLLALNRQSQKTSIRSKKLMRVLFIFSICCIILGGLDFIFFRQIERFSLLFVPLSFFLTFGLQNKTYQWLSSALLYLILAYSVGKLFLWI